MKRHAAATAALVLPGRGELVDWRIERLSLLMNEDWLAGEWDPERQLILPSPGGRLTRVLRCLVADCPSDGHGSSLLCHCTAGSSRPRI